MDVFLTEMQCGYLFHQTNGLDCLSTFTIVVFEFFPKPFAFLLGDDWHKYTNPILDFLKATYRWKHLEKDLKPRSFGYIHGTTLELLLTPRIPDAWSIRVIRCKYAPTTSIFRNRSLQWNNVEEELLCRHPACAWGSERPYLRCYGTSCLYNLAGRSARSFADIDRLWIKLLAASGREIPVVVPVGKRAGDKMDISKHGSDDNSDIRWVRGLVRWRSQLRD